MMIDTIKGMVLPESGGYRRDCVVPVAERHEKVEEQYDFTTLFYDAFYLPRKRSICLICPKLMNFEEVIKQGRFTANGEALKVSWIWRFKRFTEVWLKCRERPKTLRFQHGSFDAEIEVSHDQSELFCGMNCAVLKSKNNDLRWVRDWADYHVRVHGLQGLVFFDNNSTLYEPSEVIETLRRVPGLQRAQVISAPYRFAVISHTDTRFLQVSLLNIARMRFYRTAAAVLSADLDELIKPVPQSTIFAATQRSPLKYLLYRGSWLHAQPRPGGGTVLHSDHVYRPLSDRCWSTKYCIAPGGPVGFSHWDIHGAVRGFLKNYLITEKYGYWHCRQISTSWKFDRTFKAGEAPEFDADTARLFSEVFPGRDVAAA